MEAVAAGLGLRRPELPERPRRVSRLRFLSLSSLAFGICSPGSCIQLYIVLVVFVLLVFRREAGKYWLGHVIYLTGRAFIWNTKAIIAQLSRVQIPSLLFFRWPRMSLLSVRYQMVPERGVGGEVAVEMHIHVLSVQRALSRLEMSEAYQNSHGLSGFQIDEHCDRKFPARQFHGWEMKSRHSTSWVPL